MEITQIPFLRIFSEFFFSDSIAYSIIPNCPSGIKLYNMADKTMENMHVFQSDPGFCQRQGKYFAAVVTHGPIPKTFDRVNEKRGA